MFVRSPTGWPEALSDGLPVASIPPKKGLCMSTSLLLERGTFGGPSATPGSAGQPSATPTGNWCVVPRCKIEVEKCADGCKFHCRCDDDIACATLQNLCRMLAGGQCSLCCQL